MKKLEEEDLLPKDSLFPRSPSGMLRLDSIRTSFLFLTCPVPNAFQLIDWFGAHFI
jgi:hypothetical protein